MKKSKAKRIAYTMAWQLIQRHLEAGNWIEDPDGNRKWSAREEKEIETALLAIADALFKRGQRMADNALRRGELP